MQDRFDGSAGLPVVVIRLGVRVSECDAGLLAEANAARVDRRLSRQGRGEEECQNRK